MFLVALVCLFICLFVCLSVSLLACLPVSNITKKVTDEQIAMEFYVVVQEQVIKFW